MANIIRDVIFIEDGRDLLVCSSSSLIVWKISDKSIVKILNCGINENRNATIYKIKYYKKFKQYKNKTIDAILAADSNGNVSIWETENFTKIFFITPKKENFYDAEFIPIWIWSL
jgi:WD40 repeat protein